MHAHTQERPSGLFDQYAQQRQFQRQADAARDGASQLVAVKVPIEEARSVQAVRKAKQHKLHQPRASSAHTQVCVMRTERDHNK